jgi:GNAT superfamily N-acetyltransferase
MKIGQVSYREATLADLPAISKVRMSVVENVLSDPSKVTNEDYVAYITETGKGWVAELDGDIIGFSMANRSGLIWALFLRPGYEARGIGRNLLDLCTSWLRQVGVDRAFLDTAPGTRAEEFYRRRGWTVISRTARRIDFTLDL